MLIILSVVRLCMHVSRLICFCYRAAVWIGYYWISPDIFHIVSKLMDFWVEKCIEIMAHSMEVQKYINSSQCFLNASYCFLPSYS